MIEKNVILEVRDAEIFVVVASKMDCRTNLEKLRIPLTNRILAHGAVVDISLLRSAFEMVVNRSGRKAVYHVLLGHEQTFVKSIPLPLGIKKTDYKPFVSYLLPRLFSLPSDEISYDYRVEDNILIVLVARKQIVVSWCQFFATQQLKLATITAKAALQSDSETEDCFFRLIDEYKDTFNLIPLRKKLVVSYLCVNLCLFAFYSSVSLFLLYLCWQHFEQKRQTVSARLQQLVKLEQQKEHELQTITNLEKELNKLKNNYYKKENIVQSNSKPLAIFRAIQSIVPKNVFLREITYRKRGLVLLGKSFDYLQLKRMIKKLGKIPFVTRCQIKQLWVDNSVLMFELEIKLRDKR